MNMKQEECDPQDQACESSTYRDPEVIQQRGEGLLNRWEADIHDTLAMQNVVFSARTESAGKGQATNRDEDAQRIPISQIYIRCQWNDVPQLRQWISQFLAARQPDATIIAYGMAKQGMTRVVMNEEQSIEGYLVIGSVEQELHGTVAENVAEHLVAEKQISGYAIYTIPVVVY